MDTRKKFPRVSDIVLIIFLIAFTIGVLYKCTHHPHHLVTLKFQTLDECLIGIRASAGEDLEIASSNANGASGHLTVSKRSFGCSPQIQGAPNLGYQGWYQKAPTLEERLIKVD